MSDNPAGMRRKIHSAGELKSVVRTMKALAASSIGQYDEAVRALADYTRTVERGLGACFREAGSAAPVAEEKGRRDPGGVEAIVFGSDQGLVGQFNELMSEFTLRTLGSLPGPYRVWAVGERVHARLADAGLPPIGLFSVPNSVRAIPSLVGQIQIAVEAQRGREASGTLYVFHNRPAPGAICEPVSLRLLPLDAQWQKGLAAVPWPTRNPPEVMHGADTLRALIREYLFITLFRACAESLASENASRLAAMERADRNIDDLLENLQADFYRLRQGSIDEELFDVISGYEAMGRNRNGSAR